MSTIVKVILAIILLFDAIRFDFDSCNANINPLGYIALTIFLIAVL